MKNLTAPFKRYLKLIGIDNPPNGISGLEEIVHKHLCKIPFENVSKLVLFGKEKKGRPVTLSEFLDGIEYQDHGGTCHSNNPYLAKLLKALGYHVHLLGADMSEPNVHTCIRAIVDGVEYHIDVGYGSPFRKPMRLDQIPHEIKHGDYIYVFDRSNESHKYEMAIFSGKEKIHGYHVNEIPRSIDFFFKTITDSFKIGRTFMSYIRITRFFKEYTIELKNRTLIYYKGNQRSQKELKSLDEIENAVSQNLMMPRCRIKKAIKILEEVTQKSFFENKSCPDGF